jgi:hypothetical protein
MGGICAFTLATAATPASAGIAFLSHNGGGSTCTLAAPCVLMSTALTVAGANGEVICLDKGFYGFPAGAGLTQSVTISCGDGWWEAPSGSGLFINTPAGSDVTIEGLVADGASIASQLDWMGQGALHLRHVRIGNNSNSAHGLLFRPNGPATLHISDSVFYNNTGAGIYIKPSSGVLADVYINRTQIEKNAFGITADGSDGGLIGGVVRDSVISGNPNNGITTYSTGTSITLVVQNSTIAGNGYGLAAAGPQGAMFVTRSAINYNGAGLFGAIYSYGDNSLLANGADGSFAGTIGVK